MQAIVAPHVLELRPGVAPQEFETFVTTELIPLYTQFSGIQAYLLVGHRGARTGKYMLLIATDTLEHFEHYFPVSEGDWPEEVQRMLAASAPVWARLEAYVVHFPDPQVTDYRVVGS